MRGHTFVGAALAAGIALAGCGSTTTASPSASAPSTSASSATSAATTPASPSASRTGQGIPASGSPSAGASASVAPGTKLDPHTLARQINDAMTTVSSYRSVGHSESKPVNGSSAGAAAIADTTTIVDQRDPSTPKMRTESGGATPSILVVIGDTQYMKAGTGKFRKTALPAGSGKQLFVAGQEIDAAKSATYVGPDTVNGQDARHYSMDMGDAVSIPSAGASPVANGGAVSYDVWLDASGRLLKTVAVAPFLTSTTTFSDYGTAPAVSAPDPSEVEG